MTTSSILLKRGAFQQFEEQLEALSSYTQFVFISHPSLMGLYGDQIISVLKKLKRPVLELIIPEGEEAKSLKYAKRCWEKMLKKGIDRGSAVLALGGGVICDLSGFVASCYMRGLDSIYLPTTLLAMVDAAIGGKTGINLTEIKNGIGSFHLPKKVIIDSSSLETLSQRELNSGLAEIIKYAIISDPLLMEKLEEDIEKIKTRDHPFLEFVIQRCIAIKQAIVSEDERDLTGKRAILNYGHTFAHAIEAVTGYQCYLHGEAVAIGMSCAIAVSHHLGLCDVSLIERQDTLCKRADLPIQLPFLPIKKLLKKMEGDKKAISGKIHLILIEKIGKAVKIPNIDKSIIRKIIIKKMK